MLLPGAELFISGLGVFLGFSVGSRAYKSLCYIQKVGLTDDNGYIQVNEG